MNGHFYLALGVAVAISGTVVNAQAKDKQDHASAVNVSVRASCTSGKTQLGTETKEGTAAADPGVFPLGSRVQVEGLTGGHDGTYTVSDTGRAIKGQALDIFIADCAAAKRFGRQKARVRVLERGPAKRPASM